ncbi:hypothetical protein SAMN05428966_10263 [Massilia sp. PDC64]|nr:hypothetical protein [Massilia sp. PDC64]SDC66183.1 hypothetical protein SAMN05428966_10263 [Massilia sp. PDC64]
MTDTTYSPELGAKFCAAMASTTDSIATICKRKGMPSKATVFRWKADHPEFSKMYEAAKLEQLYGGIEECTEIADKAGKTHEEIAHAKLRIETRMKVAQRLKPKELGEKVDVNHGGQDGNPLTTVTRIELVPLTK